MSNPTRGTIGFDAGGKHYTLSYSVNALCEMEDRLGAGATAVAAQMADPSQLRIATIRTLFWAGLRDHHPDLTEAGAGGIMSEIGIPAALEIVGKAMAAAFPADAGRPLAGRQGKPGKRS